MSDENASAGPDPSSARSALERYYHVPVLGLVLAFMLWVRVRSASGFVRDGKVYLASNDPWYHLRQVIYTVENFPKTMPFDPWTGFSTGTSAGQFGTLFDQLIAAAALVVGLGDPSRQTIAMTVLYAPAVFGTLVAVPTYLVARRLWNRPAGLFAAAVLALFPGTFLRRGLVGTADHNIAEPLFQAFAVLGLMAALAAAARGRPVWEQIAERDVSGLRPVLGWGALSGVATALYIWTWPPGVLIVGVFGVFFALFLSLQYVRGESPEHAAIAGAVSLSVTALLSLVPITTLAFNPIEFSLVQPVLAAAVAVGCAFMAWLARQWDARDIERSYYPLTVLGLIVVLAGVTAVVLPDVFSTITNNVRRVIGFGVTGQTATIGEAQPMPVSFAAVFSQYGLAFFVALAAAVIALFRVATDRAGGEELLVVVWMVFMTAAAFTQARFNYYLAVPVAIMSGYALGWLLNLSFLANVSAPDDISATHVFVALSVFLVVLVPLAAPVNSGSLSKPTAASVGNNTGPGGVLGWQDTLEYMDTELPEQGNYGGAGNADQLPKYGTYDRTSDFDYPAGAYGVMSWWDYGHWITTLGDSIPVANPFQQNADTAADYLLAPNETASEEVLAGVNEDDAEVRYTAVDWQMITPGEKLFAPAVFSENLTRYDLYKPLITQQGNGYRLQRYVRTQRYYDSMMVRLYRYHGSAKQPGSAGGSVTVVDWDRESGNYLIGSGNSTRTFSNITAAREFVERDGSSQVGGVNSPSEYVPALEHYRLVKAENSAMPRRALFREGLLRSTPSWVKLFERVPGATVEGQAPENATVTAQVQMQVPGMGSQFVYTQRAQAGPDGNFEMTLPYSTTGYENWGPEEGHTNVSVRANSSYQFSTGIYTGGANGTTPMVATASANVSEAQVIGEDTGTVEVELEGQPLFESSTNRVTEADVATAEA